MNRMEQTSSICTTKFKIVMLGDMGVGKTAVIERYVKSNFQCSNNPTVGIDFLCRNISFGSKMYRMQVWDTAGQQRYKSLIPAYMRDADCGLLVFDLTNLESLQNIKVWLRLFKDNKSKNAFCVLVGNKEDLIVQNSCPQVKKKKDEILFQIGRIKKQENIKFVSVSAKNGKNIQQLFNAVIQKMAIPVQQQCSQDVTKLSEQKQIKRIIVNISKIKSSNFIQKCCNV